MNFGPVIRPRSARNINREWRFVVNLPGGEDQDDFDDFVQTVKIQRCLREGESCNVLVSGYTSTVCRSATSQHLLSFLFSVFRQKYTYKKMLAINKNGTQYVDTFRLMRFVMEISY